MFLLDVAQPVLREEGADAIAIELHPGEFKFVRASRALQVLLHQHAQWPLGEGLVLVIRAFVDRDAPALAAGVFTSCADAAKFFCILRTDRFRFDDFWAA